MQVLRALAALAVGVQHTIRQAGGFVGRPGEPVYAWLGPVPFGAGVDVFFVISGFVMVWASGLLFGRPHASWRFASRRLARVVPLYWAATALLLAVGVILPGTVSESAPSAGFVVASFLFVPWMRPDGWVQPVYRLGWTLNYEMLFYGIFSLFIPLRARVAVPCVIACIVGLACLGGVSQPTATAPRFWTDSLILEFAFGVLLAVIAPRVSLAAPARILLVVVGLAGLGLADTLPQVPHGITHGLPSFALCAGVVLGARSAVRSPLMRMGVRLGDASYALYLVHPFAMRGLAMVWSKAGSAGSVGILGYIVAVMGATVVLAWGVHLWIERPLTAAARHSLRVLGPVRVS